MEFRFANFQTNKMNKVFTHSFIFSRYDFILIGIYSSQLLNIRSQCNISFMFEIYFVLQISRLVLKTFFITHFAFNQHMNSFTLIISRVGYQLKFIDIDNITAQHYKHHLPGFGCPGEYLIPCLVPCWSPNASLQPKRDICKTNHIFYFIDL